ncbi:restriction endonuclease subunit S [Prochlorococcus marinus]|uniref:restriction endonuclease subunit S n=1 Tax=Prochlorococcus marinus TaxID=1219 RepID=UPI0039B12798
MKPIRLPDSWIKCKLGEVLEYGKTIKADPEVLQADSWLLELEDIEKDSSKLISQFTVKERKPKSTKNKFECGQVLYGKLRPYLNKVIIAHEDGYCSTEIIPLPNKSALNSRYVFYWLKSQEFIKYSHQVSHGTNMPRLGTKAGNDAPFILAPLKEQNRITRKLDITFKSIESCKQKLNKTKEIIKHLRQSLLTDAVSGELTKNWRKEKAIKTPFKKLIINDLGDVVTGNTPKAVDIESTKEIPLFKPTELDQGYETCNAKEMMSKERAEKARILPPLTILVTCIGATIGKTGLSRREGATNQQINSLICNEEVALPKWAYFWFCSPIGQNAIINNASATTLPILNKSRFKALGIEVPEIEEQKEIISKVENYLEKIKDIESKIVLILSTCETLSKAVLTKAFSGELVPQDPNDEPAYILLKRIQKEKTI